MSKGPNLPERKEAMIIMQSDRAPHHDGVVTLYATIALLCQTFFLGAFAVITPFSAYIIKKRDLSRFKWLMYCTCFMMLVSLAYWIASVASLVVGMKSSLISPSLSLQNKLIIVSSMRSSVILINYIVTDGVVVWRAWVLNRADYIKCLYCLVLFLFLTSTSGVVTIAIRIAIIIVCAGNGFSPAPTRLQRAIDITQASSLIWTLITNVTATSLIAFKAWKHRQLVKSHLKDASNGGRAAGSLAVLALVVESGTLYCLSNVAMVFSDFIHLPYGTMAQIYGPFNSLLAAVYPCVVSLIVGLQMTMEDATTGIAHDDSGLDFALPRPSDDGAESTHSQSTEFPIGARHRTLVNSSISQDETCTFNRDIAPPSRLDTTSQTNGQHDPAEIP